jgi:DNA polymerase-1
MTEFTPQNTASIRRRKTKRLYLIDGYALIYRAYYAFIRQPITTRDGLDTSAIFGFIKNLLEFLRKEHPSHVMVALDPGGKTFRHEKYPNYKAQRKETPEAIKVSIPVITEMLQALRIPVVVLPGYEADDIIGTLAKKAENKGFVVFMVTPDKDYGQLVSENIYIYKLPRAGSDAQQIGVPEILKTYQIDHPSQVVDVLTLWGDASDNIPGLEGVGEIRAKRLINEFGSVENLLKNIDLFSGVQRLKLEKAREWLPIAKELITIDTNAPVKWNEELAVFQPPDTEKLRKLFIRYEFNSLLRYLDTLPVKSPEPTSSPSETGTDKATQQLSLFGEPIQKVLPEENYTTLANTPHAYHTVQTEEEITALLHTLEKHPAFCFHTESTGIEPMRSELIGLSFALRPHEAWYLPLPPNRQEAQGILQRFKPLFEESHKAKIGQNMKHDLLLLKQYGVEVHGFLYDTLLMHYLLETEGTHNITALCHKYLNYHPMEIEELGGKNGPKPGALAQVPLSQISTYAAEGADLTCRLKERLEKELIHEKLMKLYTSIEEPLIRVLTDMEFEGVKIDTRSLEESKQEFLVQFHTLDEEIKELAGIPDLNISSPKQLGEALFEEMNLKSRKKTKTYSYSTSEEALQLIADSHPIIPKILAYRTLLKIISGYLNRLPTLVNRRTGKIHTTYNQFVTATGRLSSNNPNLQNIPIRDENGREIRKAFIASDKNHVLLSADYSQIELRLMAHLSEDPQLQAAFLEQKDVHSMTAAEIFHVPVSEVTKEQRRQAKTANFGIIYGISIYGLAERLQISKSEAQLLISGYFASYPKVKRYINHTIMNAHKQGVVSTLFGRIRKLEDIWDNNGNVRHYAERNAINAPVQGSAADIIKIAMIKVHAQLRERNLKSRLILQVHDELVLDVYKPELDEVKQLVQYEMENAAQLSVPLAVEIGVGNNWLEAH